MKNQQNEGTVLSNRRVSQRGLLDIIYCYIKNINTHNFKGQHSRSYGCFLGLPWHCPQRVPSNFPKSEQRILFKTFVTSNDEVNVIFAFVNSQDVNK